MRPRTITTTAHGTIALHGVDTGLPTDFRVEQYAHDCDDYDLCVKRAVETGDDRYWQAAEALNQRIADTVEALKDSLPQAMQNEIGAQLFLAEPIWRT